MRKVFQVIAIAIMLMSPIVASAQVGIPGTSLTLSINSEDWRYLRTFKLDDGADIYLYYYIGHDIVDAEGDTILPCLRIYVNEHYDGDLYSLVYDRYMQQPYQSLNEYTHGLGLPKSGGIGYDGIYTNPSDGKDYRFLMTYFKDRRTMVELRLETTSDTFGEIEFEFKDLLGTLK